MERLKASQVYVPLCAATIPRRLVTTKIGILFTAWLYLMAAAHVLAIRLDAVLLSLILAIALMLVAI